MILKGSFAMSLTPISELDFSLMPIEGGIDYEPLPPDWGELLPQKEIKPDLLASINEIAGQVGSIFDAGWSIYNKVRGRVTANEQIAQDTIRPEPTPIILQQTKGFYEIYSENKTAVYLIGGGLILLTMSLLIKKVF